MMMVSKQQQGKILKAIAVESSDATPNKGFTLTQKFFVVPWTNRNFLLAVRITPTTEFAPPSAQHNAATRWWLVDPWWWIPKKCVMRSHVDVTRFWWRMKKWLRTYCLSISTSYWVQNKLSRGDIFRYQKFPLSKELNEQQEKCWLVVKEVSLIRSLEMRYAFS